MRPHPIAGHVIKIWEVHCYDCRKFVFFLLTALELCRIDTLILVPCLSMVPVLFMSQSTRAKCKVHQTFYTAPTRAIDSDRNCITIELKLLTFLSFKQDKKNLFAFGNKLLSNA